MSILPVVPYCARCQESIDALLSDVERPLNHADLCGNQCPVCYIPSVAGYECPDCGLLYDDEDAAIRCCNWDVSREGYRLIYAAKEAAGQLRLEV